ncbi:MAG: hypothetical protein FWD73_13235 [Polyangiaceae bacterium]|nr:hypothetical protein [Polyangiaceae bacterium]
MSRIRGQSFSVAVAALATALTIVVFAVAWAGRVSEGRQALAKADAAIASGNMLEAIAMSRAAAEARCPGCTASEQGFSRLETIAKLAELRADNEAALSAWRAVRAASIASGVFRVHTARREHADAELVRLGHRASVVDAAERAPLRGPSRTVGEEQLATMLDTSTVPTGATYALVGIGAIAFLVGTIRFARQRTSDGFNARDAWDLLLCAVGFAVAVCGALFF